MSYKTHSERRNGNSYSSDRHRNSHKSRRESSRRLSSPSTSSNSSRDSDELPISFGRSEKGKEDSDLTVLQRMKTSDEHNPLKLLYRLKQRKEKIKVWTRSVKNIRGVMTAYVVAFDKHWNMILKDVDEIYFKAKKNKAPFLRDVVPGESLPDIPARVPKKKGKAQLPPLPQVKKEGSGKRGERRKKSKTETFRRHFRMLFVRGDSIVVLLPFEELKDEDDGDCIQLSSD